jgi:hypothetical protein
MKKDLHDLLYSIWIDSRTAMIIWEEPHGTRHFEVHHNEFQELDRFHGETDDKTGLFGATINREKKDQNRENEHLRKFVKEVAAKVRYAQAIYILGSGDTRHLLQNEIESNKELREYSLTNSAFRKLDRREFELETEKLFHSGVV